VLADTAGAPVSFSQLLFGRQTAADGPSRANVPQGALRQAARSAALRQEVVHASADVLGPDLDRVGARRATTAERVAPAASGGPSVTAVRSPAAQPPAIPDTRRPLVHDYFRRVAEPPPPRQP
jgi:hypothetical protein